MLLYFVMKFLGSESFSLPEVWLLLLAIVDLHLWILVCLFFGDLLVVHFALGMAALATDGLWNG